MAREELVVRGNTVLAPKSTPYRKKEIKQKQNNNKVNKFGILRNIVIAFAIGLILIGRYSNIYNMQKQLNTTKSNITELNKQNDNLKVELVKYNNLQYIEEVAVNKLKMVPPIKDNAVYCNTDKERVITASKAVASDKGPGNIVAKVIKSIF